MSSHVPSLILNLFIAAFLSPGGVPVPLRRSSPLATFLFLTALVSPMVVFLCFPRGAAPFSCGAICSLVVPLSFFAVLPFSLLRRSSFHCGIITVLIAAPSIPSWRCSQIFVEPLSLFAAPPTFLRGATLFSRSIPPFFRGISLFFRGIPLFLVVPLIFRGGPFLPYRIPPPLHGHCEVSRDTVQSLVAFLPFSGRPVPSRGAPIIPWSHNILRRHHAFVSTSSFFPAHGLFIIPAVIISELLPPLLHHFPRPLLRCFRHSHCPHSSSRLVPCTIPLPCALGVILLCPFRLDKISPHPHTF